MIRTRFPLLPPPLFVVVIEDELLFTLLRPLGPRLPCEGRRERDAMAERGNELRPSFTLNLTLNIVCHGVFQGVADLNGRPPAN